MWVPVSNANFQYLKVPSLRRGMLAHVFSSQLGSSVVPELDEERIGLVKMPAASSG